MLETGRALKHYEIVRLLGRGGMGEVYAARDRKLGREVALKVLPEELAENDERRERFEREARAVAALRHPNIVTLHAIEEADGLTFMVMELIEGRPLSEAIPRGGLELEEFLKIAVPLADAVAAAHARGITHRDLKPANVLIDTEGRTQVLDFGLAKVSADGLAMDAGSLQPTEALTGEGKIVGTIAYMSPEQVEGKPVDARSDIFSLGVLFYEMLTGARPFDGDTGVSVITSILRDEPVSVTERNERLPRYLGRIVRRCLQKDPSRRYQSALDLRNDLVELGEELKSGELESPAATTPAPVQRGVGARIAVGVALLVVALAGGWWLLGRGDEDASEPTAVAYSVRRLTARNPGSAAISPDGRYVAYVSVAPGGRSLRLQQIASGTDVELVPTEGWSTLFANLAFTRDGDYVRYASGTGGRTRTLWEVPVLGGAPRRLVDSFLVGPAYSPDGSRVALVPGEDFTERWSRLEVVSLADGSRRTLLEFPEDGSEIEIAAWSPDGRRLVLQLTGGDEGLVLLSLEDGAMEPIPGARFSSIGDLCWTPDAKRLIVLGHPGPSLQQIWSVEIESGARRLLIPDVHSYDSCSMTADGRLMATVREETHSQIWVVPLDDPKAARPVATTTGRSDGATRVSWLDGATLAYSAPDRDTWNVWRVGADGGTSMRVTEHGANNPASSGTGRLVFESGWEPGTVAGIYAAESGGRGQRRLSPEGQWARRPVVSPDGEWVLYELLRDRMQLVRSPWKGGEPEVMTSVLAHMPSVSPDGRRVAMHYRDPEIADSWQTAIFPIEGDAPERIVDLHSETHSPWAGDDALFISRTVDGVGNIFRVNLEDLSEEQVTFFTDGQIFSFDVSPDLTRLAIGRGEVVNDLLLIEGLLGGTGDR